MAADGKDRARRSLLGHALLERYLDLPQNVQIDIAYVADRLVDDIAASTQDRRFLRGDDGEDLVLTSAIFGNAVCMMVRWEVS